MVSRLSFSTRAEAIEVAERFRAQKLAVKVVRRGGLWYLDVEEPVLQAPSKSMSLADVQARAEVERETRRQASALRKAEQEYTDVRSAKRTQASETKKRIAKDIKERAVKYAREEAVAKAPLDVTTPRITREAKKPSRFRAQYVGRKTYRTKESADIMAEKLRERGTDAIVRKTPYGHQIVTMEGKRERAQRGIGYAGKKALKGLSEEIFRPRTEQEELQHPVTGFRWRRKGNIGSRLPARRAPVGRMPSGRPPVTQRLDITSMQPTKLKKGELRGYYTGTKKGGD